MNAIKFDLGLYCLGNGITVCNRAVKENGDYKIVAHISNSGKIKYCVDLSYIPEYAILRINECSETIKNEFAAAFNRYNKERQYSILMENSKVFMKFIGDKRPWKDRFEEMKDYYFDVV